MSMSAMGLLDIRLGCRLIRCSPFLGHPGNCNILENVYAITYIFVLQLSVLLLCNKQDERTFEQFKHDLKVGNKPKCERPTKEQLEATIKDSYKIMQNFEIEKEGG